MTIQEMKEVTTRVINHVQGVAEVDKLLVTDAMEQAYTECSLVVKHPHNRVDSAIVQERCHARYVGSLCVG
jgi:hypothetical protein